MDSLRIVLITAILVILPACGGGGSGTPQSLASTNDAPVVMDAEPINIGEGHTEVVKLVATDASSDQITFSISAGVDKHLFIINGSTGDLTFINSPDFESPQGADGNNQYKLTAAASDAKVSPNLDNALEGRVDDGPMAGSSVFVDLNGNGIQEANEPSGVTDGKVFFSINQPNNTEAKIIAKGGTDTATDVELSELVPVSDISTDLATSISVTPITTLLARGSSIQEKLTLLDALYIGSVGQAITLSVNNLDEIAPAIISSDTASIEENTGAGQVIYAAIADDSADYSDGVTYSLSVDPVLHSQTGAIERRFIDNADGSITLQLLVDSSVVGGYPDGIENLDLAISYNPAEVVDIAADQIVAPGNPFMGMVNTSVSGEIKVAYVYFPAALDLVSETPILEVDFNLESGVTSAGFEISGVRFNEDDLTGAVFQSWYLGDGTLSIDTVTLATDPDYESQPLYSFTVTATNGAGKASEQAATVNVADVADFVPTITSGETASSIDENSGVAQVIYTATSDRSAVTYSLAEGGDGGLSINATTGEVTLTANQNYEAQSEYSFTVAATDMAGSASDGKAVTLLVNNLDEAAPAINSGVTATAIDENSGAVQVIYTATADDSADISGGVIFSLEDTAAYASTGSGSLESVVSIPELASSIQHVYVSESTKSEDGSQATVVVSYNADDSITTGLGLRVHYNSSLLTFDQFAEVLSTDNIASDGPFNDTEDLDNDPSTDKYLMAAWTSLFGSWPGALPETLVAIDFTVTEPADDVEYTSIGFSSSSDAAGYRFVGDSYDLNIVNAIWDFDQSGSADALTDGLLLLRHAFGLRGSMLTNDAVAPDSPLIAAEVELSVDSAYSVADIDENDTVDALTDGLLLLRYLFGLRGEALIADAVSLEGTRTSVADIESHIQNFMPFN